MRLFIVNLAFHRNKIAIIHLLRALCPQDSWDPMGLKEAVDWTKDKVSFHNLEDEPTLKRLTLQVNETELGRLYYYVNWGPKVEQLHDSRILSVEEVHGLVDFDLSHREYKV